MDKAILLKINREWTNPALDQIMVAFSSLPVWMPLFIALATALVIWGNFRARAFLLVLAITIAVTDGLVARTLKYSVDRPRPHQTESGLLVRKLSREKIPQLAVFEPIVTRPTKPAREPVEGRSFPSAHTMNMFATATTAWLFFRGYWWLLYIPASIVAYSRVYTASHWPSDILPSMVMGIVLGFLVPILLNNAWRKFGNRLVPKWHAKHTGFLGKQCPVNRIR